MIKNKINEILQSEIRLSPHDLFQDNEAFIFLQNLASWHAAKVCNRWFEENHIQV